MMKYLRIFFFVFLVDILMLSYVLYAGTTGKISGKVRDANTGEPLVGANVIIEGVWLEGIEVEIFDKMGAATDIDGNFFITNIAPGTYTLVVRVIGYKTQKLKVDVSVDKTTFLDIKMTEEAIKGEEVVVVATKERIQKDLTSSKSTLSADRIDVLAVENVNSLVDMQAGVVDGHFRGGRLGEVAYMIDGVMVNNDFSSSRESAVDVDPESVQDILVISGTFNAEYGKAMSGIVNTVTKEGGNNFVGKILMYAGNYVSSHDNIFIGIDNKDFNRIKDYKFTFSGPIIKNRLTFFINGRYNNDGGYIYGIRRFNVTDSSNFESINSAEWYSEHTGDGKEVSLNNSLSKSAFAKLTLRLFSNLKISFSSILNRNEYKTTGGYYESGITDKQYHGDDGWMYKYVPDGAPTLYNNSDYYALDINHVLTPGLFYNLKLIQYETENMCYVYKNPLDSRYVHPKYSYSRPGFYTGGNYKLWDHNGFIKKTLKFDLNYQLNIIHEFKTGFEYSLNTVKVKHYDIINGNTTNSGEFIPRVMDDESFYTEVYTKEPREFSAYLQDKMEFKEMVINLGVRFDMFDPASKYPTDYRNPDNSNMAVTFRSEYKDAEIQYQISPRFGLAYQLGSAASLHFSYGHFFQMPGFYSLYKEHNFHVSSYNYETQMGNPRLKAEKTVSYEVGLQQEVYKNLVVDVSVFYRDIYNLLTLKSVQTYDARVYGLYDNLDYATAKGIILNVDYQYDRLFFNFNYSLQYAEGEASNPKQFFLKAGTADPVIKLTRLDYDQRHTLNASVGYKYKNLDASLILNWNSNTPYTYEPKVDSYSAKADIPENNSDMPSRFNADFSLHYNFNITKKIKTKFYLEVYNLFDNLNENAVFSTTGRANSSLDVETLKENYRSDFTTLEEFLYRPDYYSQPRMVKVGLSFNFIY